MISINNCTGCGACHDICPRSAISMTDDENGCLVPVIHDSLCISCNLCETVCPKDQVRGINTFQQRYFAASNADIRIRTKSTSGGVVSVLMDYIISNGGYVAGVLLDENLNAQFILSNDNNKCEKFRKSKYVQAHTEGIYSSVKEKLNNEYEVLFVGLPCQVHALKLYLKKEYKKLITVDLICFGVVPPKIFQDYIKYKERKVGKRITGFTFRGRDEVKGWHKNCFKVEYEDGTEEKIKQSNDYYYGLYFKNIAIRESCFSCQYKTPIREGDITLGDFWGIERVAPDLDSNDGVSVMAINSEKGNRIFENIRGKLNYREFQDNILNYRSTTTTNTPYKFRKAFFRAYKKHGISYAGFLHVSVYRLLSKIPLIKNIYR